MRIAVTHQVMKIDDEFYVEATYDGEFNHWSVFITLNEDGPNPESALKNLAIRAQRFAESILGK